MTRVSTLNELQQQALTLFIVWNDIFPPTPVMCLFIHYERIPASYFISEIPGEMSRIRCSRCVSVNQYL